MSIVKIQFNTLWTLVLILILCDLLCVVQFQSESRTGGETITHNEQGLRGSIADRYVDHKRSELLSAIVDLELVSNC